MRALLCLLLMTVGAVSAPQAAPCAEPPGFAATEFNAMMTALIGGDYDRFVANGTAQVKAALSKTMFEGVCEQIGSRLKKGYTATYLTQIRQQGCEVYVWKVILTDGGDDFLAKLAMENGKVAGFRFQ